MFIEWYVKIGIPPIAPLSSMAAQDIPFELRELARPDAPTARLFARAFGGAPPDFPRHFVAVHGPDAAPAAYVHYTVFEDGVFLCGGLGVDACIDRRLDAAVRAALGRAGSLSRWLLEASANALGPKRAVFAYTGDVRSRRDVLALGYAPAAGKHLLVHWHSEPAAGRARLVQRVAALGPF
jgi:hypothetical protein